MARLRRVAGGSALRRWGRKFMVALEGEYPAGARVMAAGGISDTARGVWQTPIGQSDGAECAESKC